MKTSSYFDTKVHKALGKFFDKSTMSQLARLCGFALRKAKKITAFHFVAGFFLCCSKGVTTYEQWARQIGLLSGKPLSRQALWERIHEGTVNFVQTLLEKALIRQAFKAVPSALFTSFKRVLLQDSTTFSLPDSLSHLFPGPVVRGVQRATARIQSILEVKRMQVVNFSLGAYTQNDQSASADIVPIVAKGDLLIRDLGYFVLKALQQLGAKADFLSRLRFGVTCYDCWGEEIDLQKLLKKNKKVDRWVYIGARDSVWVRLVMLPLPKQQAAERVRKAKADRDKRLNHGKTYYQWLGYHVFVTTVDKSIWSTADVAKAYGVRWQIEIIFKSWKSGFHMQVLLAQAKEEEHRVKTTIYLLLLFSCLFMQKVYLRYREVVERRRGQLLSVLRLSALFFRNMLELLMLSHQKLKEQIILYGCYEQRKDRKNLQQKIRYS